MSVDSPEFPAGYWHLCLSGSGGSSGLRGVKKGATFPFDQTIAQHDGGPSFLEMKNSSIILESANEERAYVWAADA
jgi:hypothetical protein